MEDPRSLSFLAGSTGGLYICLLLLRDVAQPGSALRSGRRRRWFESSHPDLNPCISGLLLLELIGSAQLKPGLPGAVPYLQKLPETSKAVYSFPWEG